MSLSMLMMASRRQETARLAHLDERLQLLAALGGLFFAERGLLEAELAHQRALLGARHLHAQRLGLLGLFVDLLVDRLDFAFDFFLHLGVDVGEVFVFLGWRLLRLGALLATLAGLGGGLGLGRGLGGRLDRGGLGAACLGLDGLGRGLGRRLGHGLAHGLGGRFGFRQGRGLGRLVIGGLGLALGLGLGRGGRLGGSLGGRRLVGGLVGGLRNRLGGGLHGRRGLLGGHAFP
jgi:hypothetical protein